MTAIDTRSENPFSGRGHGLDIFLTGDVPFQVASDEIISIPLEIPESDIAETKKTKDTSDHFEESEKYELERSGQKFNLADIESLKKPIDNPTTFTPITELDELTRRPLVEALEFAQEVDDEASTLSAHYEERKRRVQENIARLQAELEAIKREGSAGLELLERKKDSMLQIVSLAIDARCYVQKGASELTESLGTYLTPAINSIKEATEDRDRVQNLLKSAHRNLETYLKDKKLAEGRLSQVNQELEQWESVSRAEIKKYKLMNPHADLQEDSHMMRPETWEKLCNLRMDVGALKKAMQNIDPLIDSLQRDIPNLVAVLRAHEVALRRSYEHAEPLYERAQAIFQTPQEEARALLDTVNRALQDFHQVDWRSGEVLEISTAETADEVDESPSIPVRPTEMIPPSRSPIDVGTIRKTWSGRRA